MFKFIAGFFAGLVFAVITVFLGACGFAASTPPPKRPVRPRPSSL